MGKALMLKDVNFSANKLTTVELGDNVPCTALSLSTDSIAFTAIGATQQITATPTPANTTETVEWSSSDTNCVTVVNGLVTCVGVGTATITAKCGEITATCSVSASVTFVLDDDMTMLTGYSIANSSDRDYVTSSSNERAKSFFAIGNPLSGYRAISKTDEVYMDKYPIPLPANAKTLTIQLKGSDYYNCAYALLNANEKCTYSLTDSAKGARAYPCPIIISHPSDETVIDISGRNENVNSFCAGAICDSSKTLSNVSKVTIIFS